MRVCLLKLVKRREGAVCLPYGTLVLAPVHCAAWPGPSSSTTNVKYEVYRTSIFIPECGAS